MVEVPITNAAILVAKKSLLLIPTLAHRASTVMRKWQRTLTVKGNSVVGVLRVPVTAMTVDQRRKSVLPVDIRQGNTRISAPVHP
jgi:hypothetical protein